MKKIGDFIIYKKNTCKIKEIKNKTYYVLYPINDNSLKITIPIDNEEIREIISKEELEQLLLKMPTIEIIELEQSKDRMIESIYKDLLKTNKLEDLIKIIKTTYIRNKEREDNNKKIGEKDELYFNKAEEYLYNEFSIVLGLSFEDTKNMLLIE